MIDYDALISCAVQARELSYSPYSRFSVGCAVLCGDGSIYTGCNIENASFSETVCAERTAIFKAVSQGNRGFVAIAIVGGGEKIEGFTYPCGACRQVMSEFFARDTEIILFDGKEKKILTLGELLPNSFNKESLS